MAEKYLIHSESSVVTLEVDADDDGVLVRREGEEHWKRAHLDSIGNSGLFVLMLDNEPQELYLERQRGGALVTIGRHIFDYAVDRWRPSLAERALNKDADVGLHKVLAPMTGSVVEVVKNKGDEVANGDIVLIIESMKMNNEMRAPADGVVESVSVKPGDRVKAGAVLMTIQA